jgi:hypothetical protein
MGRDDAGRVPHGAESGVDVLADSVTRTRPLYERVKAVIPPIEWPVFADDIEAILELKRARKAVILAHTRPPRFSTAWQTSSAIVSVWHARR